jgi:glycosyltransferase involved in cell wall biosynthesis
VDGVDPRLGAKLVTLHGQPHDSVATYLSACDALLMTSSSEGSPTIVKEALASGLPVVSVPVGDVGTRVRGVPECRLCRSDDPAEIVHRLEEVLRDPARSQAARDAVADLDHSIITPKLIELYEKLASGAAAVNG